MTRGPTEITHTQTTPVGRQSTVTLDLDGRPLKTEIPGSALYPTVYEYDTDGRVERVIVGPNGDPNDRSK